MKYLVSNRAFINYIKYHELARNFELKTSFDGTLRGGAVQISIPIVFCESNKDTILPIIIQTPYNFPDCKIEEEINNFCSIISVFKGKTFSLTSDKEGVVHNYNCSFDYKDLEFDVFGSNFSRYKFQIKMRISEEIKKGDK